MRAGGRSHSFNNPRNKVGENALKNTMLRIAVLVFRPQPFILFVPACSFAWNNTQYLLVMMDQALYGERERNIDILDNYVCLIRWDTKHRRKIHKIAHV